VARRQREPSFDPHEFGARRSDPSLAGFDPLPPMPRRLRPRTVLAAFAAVVVVGATIHGGARPQGPALAASCTTPAYAVSTLQAPEHGVVRYTAVGPAGSSVVFALDSTAPPAATAPELLAGPRLLDGCRAAGQFEARGTTGRHRLSVFAVAQDGRTTALRSQSFTITG
jgi:hypothetical protein